MSKDAHSRTTAKQYLCPVCTTLLKDLEAAETIDHGVHVHYFCSAKCKAEFEKDPKKYH